MVKFVNTSWMQFYFSIPLGLVNSCGNIAGWLIGSRYYCRQSNIYWTWMCLRSCGFTSLCFWLPYGWSLMLTSAVCLIQLKGVAGMRLLIHLCSDTLGERLVTVNFLTWNCQLSFYWTIEHVNQLVEKLTKSFNWIPLGVVGGVVLSW